MRFIVFMFIVFGCVEIIIKGKPTAPLRWLFGKLPLGKEFIHCPLCLGFWVGMFWGYWLFNLLPVWYLDFFADACAGAGSAHFLHQLVNVPSFED